VLAGAGVAAGVTVGALLAEDMIGSTGSAVLHAALLTLGSAAAAAGVGRISQRSGRRPGLALGYAVGAIGGAGVVLGAAVDSVALLSVSLLLYGSGTATNLQAQHAALGRRRGRPAGLAALQPLARALHHRQAAPRQKQSRQGRRRPQGPHRHLARPFFEVRGHVKDWVLSASFGGRAGRRVLRSLSALNGSRTPDATGGWG